MTEREYAPADLPMASLMGSILEVLGVTLVALGLGAWLSVWLSVVVVGVALTAYGVLLDRQGIER